MVAKDPVLVAPTVAPVTRPSGWAVPVPVVKCWLRMRPTRTPSRSASHESALMALSYRNCREARTNLLVYM